jgi:transcriptional regulator with XRE-family HTH domain
MHRSTFGELLRASRLAAGMTQEALAARAGLSARVISDLERSAKHTPRAATVQLLVEALPIPPAERRFLAAVAASAAADAENAADDSPPQDLPAIGRAQLSGRDARTSLIGRHRERAVIEEHLVTGRTPLLVFEGEPGIGKTRLLQEAAELASARGLHVLWGASTAPGRAVDPVLDALRREIRARPSLDLQRDLHGCGRLVHLLPELAEGPTDLAPPQSVPPEQADELAARAVMQFLSNIAGPSGTLLVLDNLPDTAPDGLDLLARLTRAAADVPLRIVAAYRGALAAPAALDAWLAWLVHEDLVRHVQLGPLTRENATDLLTQALAVGPVPLSSWRDRTLDLAGGLPFYLLAWARALHLEQPDGPFQGVPWAVRQSVRQRVLALPRDARGVLECVVVAGDDAGYPLLVALSGLPEQDLAEALDAACREHLLEADGQMYRFRYGAVRLAVEADMNPARHNVLNRRLARLAERAGSGRHHHQPAEAPPAADREAAEGPGQPDVSAHTERAYHLAVLRSRQRLTRPRDAGS